MARQPALSVGSSLVSALVPLPGSSVQLTVDGVALQLDDPSRAGGYALVLPLAYDSALRASSGQMRNIGGLAALTGVDGRQVTVRFVPDRAALLRAFSMTLAQILAVAGFVGLAGVTCARRRSASTGLLDTLIAPDGSSAGRITGV